MIGDRQAMNLGEVPSASLISLPVARRRKVEHYLEIKPLTPAHSVKETLESSYLF